MNKVFVLCGLLVFAVVASANVCSWVGQNCADTYQETRDCPNGQVRVNCHKRGQCTGIGAGHFCSWGAGSYCEQPNCGSVPQPPSPPPSSGGLRCPHAANFIGRRPDNPPGSGSWSGQCVSLIALCEGKGVSTWGWRKGSGRGTFSNGDVIATFNHNGNYEGHVAVFESNGHGNCFNVIHSNWNGNMNVHRGSICSDNYFKVVV